jgi:hypothetical protein
LFTLRIGNQVNFWDAESYRKDGLISDCTDGSAHQKFIDKVADESDGCRILTLTANMDGVKLFEDGNRSMWPIILAVNELPKEKRLTKITLCFNRMGNSGCLTFYP